MHENLPLISTIAIALVFALCMGFIAIKLKLPTLVGYLLAGVLIGPFTPGLVADTKIAAELAEIGVMLLMFGVGLHFSFDNLLKNGKIALPGALMQMVVATCMGFLLAYFWGFSIIASLVFGLALSVASTVVLVRTLEAEGLVGTTNGQIAVGWLIVEDLAMILVLILLPFFAEWLGEGVIRDQEQSLAAIVGIRLLEISSFIVVMFIFGRWLVPKMLWQIARTGSRELFTLFTIAAAVGIAFGAAKQFGVSFALGAFFAGMIMRESQFSKRAAEESLPFRDAFAVLFFVSMGMLFDPRIFITHPLAVLGVVGIIVIGKSLAAALLVLLLRYPLNTALTVSASLAQIGEFSFILAGFGLSLKVLPQEGLDLIITGALISIAINPFIFKLIKPIQKILHAESFQKQTMDPFTQLPSATGEKFLSGQVVLVGFGRVGKRIARTLAKQKLPYVVVDQNYELIVGLRKNNCAAIYGDASEPYILMQAHIQEAGMLVIATSDTFNISKIICMARQINPKITVALGVENEEEVLFLKQQVKAKFFFNERELAAGMTRYILRRYGMDIPE